MNEFANNNTAALNEATVQIGAIKLPDGTVAFEGASLNMKLTDRAAGDSNAFMFNAMKFALPVIAEKIETWVRTRLQIEDQRREEYKKATEAENEERLKDWELHCKDFEEAKKQFEKQHRDWERRKEQAGDNFTEWEPTFNDRRPERPYLNIVR